MNVISSTHKREHIDALRAYIRGFKEKDELEFVDIVLAANSVKYEAEKKYVHGSAKALLMGPIR